MKLPCLPCEAAKRILERYKDSESRYDTLDELVARELLAAHKHED